MNFIQSVAAGLAVVVGLAAAVSGAAPAGAAEGVLDRVRARGQVVCGIDQTPGFSRIDESGRPHGFEVDFCRAVAAAVLGDADAIRTARVSTAHKFDAVTAGDIDIAFGMTTWTYTREVELGTAFPTVLFYDGQGFMAWADSGLETIDDLAGASICVQTGTTSEANLRDALRRFPGATIVPAASSEEKFTAFAQRRCAVVTGDRSELAAQRSRRTIEAESWRFIPGVISREPLGPVVSGADGRWRAIVRWALLVPVIAEARGLGQQTIATAGPPTDREMARLLRQDPDFGTAVGLDPAWARRIIEAVGNYGEIFARNLAPLGFDRGENALWRDGGLLYAPPLR